MDTCVSQGTLSSKRQREHLKAFAPAIPSAWNSLLLLLHLPFLTLHGKIPWMEERGRLLHPWDFPGKSTGVGCHCLLW